MKQSRLNPKEEAQRYLLNAKEILKEKAGKKDGLFSDIKYVRMASGTAYSAALIILDEYLSQKEGIKFKKPKSIEEYRLRLAKQNKKLLAILADVYDELHLAGYYHGTQSVNTIQTGLTNVDLMLEFI